MLVVREDNDMWYSMKGKMKQGRDRQKRGENKTYSMWNLQDSMVSVLAKEPR